jgi:hypothetical protein
VGGEGSLSQYAIKKAQFPHYPHYPHFPHFPYSLFPNYFCRQLFDGIITSNFATYGTVKIPVYIPYLPYHQHQRLFTSKKRRLPYHAERALKPFRS